MIKLGDIYINRENMLVKVDNVTKRKHPNLNAPKNALTYIGVSRVKTHDITWYGTWELEWFLKNFRPATKLERLLAGL